MTRPPVGFRRTAFAVSLLALVGGVGAGCNASDEASSGSSTAGSSTTSEPQPENNPAKNASESNVPRVGPTGSVEVDDLRWRIVRHPEEADLGWHSPAHPEVGTAYTLGSSPNYVQASGVFVVANVEVTSHKSESVNLNSAVVNLVGGGKTYSVDTEAAIATSGKTLDETELGPALTATLQLVFDVAPEMLHQHPELRFNELGLGTTHGYIALPALKVE